MGSYLVDWKNENDEEPLCVNCRWYRLMGTAGTQRPQDPDPDMSICAKSKVVDTVTGKVLSTWTDCTTMRKGSCGVEGALFEPREK
jgi:hypothetical protein